MLAHLAACHKTVESVEILAQAVRAVFSEPFFRISPSRTQWKCNLHGRFITRDACG